MKIWTLKFIQELSTLIFYFRLDCQFNLNYPPITTGLCFFIPFFAIGLTVLTRCVKIRTDMVNKFSQLIRKSKKSEAKLIKEDFLSRLGREQLSKISERGLDLPIALL